MKRKKTVKKQASEFNTSSMSKPRKILYNKIIKNYRFSEILLGRKEFSHRVHSHLAS